MQPIVTLYISLLGYGGLIGLIAFLLFKTILRRSHLTSEVSGLSRLFAAAVAFSVVVFAYSDRVPFGYFSPDGVALTLMFTALWLLFDRGLKTWSHTVTMLLLVIGMTFSGSDVILILVPFFVVLSIRHRGSGKEGLLSLIPLSYLTLAGALYVIKLMSYVNFAWTGFLTFLQTAFQGQVVETVVPLNRAIALTRQDVILTSLGYLSLMFLSLITVTASTVVVLKRRGSDRQDRDLLSSASVCLWIALVIATVGYIGTRSMPQTSSSDTSTTSILFLTMLLPFAFISRSFNSNLTRHKLLCIFVILLIALSSIRPIYEVYPKSIGDPVNILEDIRHTYSVAVNDAWWFVASHYPSGLIIGDYSALNPNVQQMISGPYALIGGFARSYSYPKAAVLMLSTGEGAHPSIVHSSEVYQVALSFAGVHDRVYDNGAMFIAWWQTK
jgi:hypothetical protein